MTETLIPTGLKAITAFAQATNSVNKLKKLYNKYICKTTRVLVVGESGSGKTQFLKTLTKVGGIEKQSTMLSHSVKLELADGHMVEFIDTPGQQSLQDQRGTAINDISRKKYQGIINIVCYGYQASSDTNLSDVFKSGTTEVKESYLDNNRKKELKQLEEWIPRIDSECKLEWVLTVVNKADIWYEKKEEVMAYYGSKYKDMMVRISQFEKSASVPYCSVITPFCNMPMQLTMTDDDRLIMHKGLCDQLALLMKLTWN